MTETANAQVDAYIAAAALFAQPILRCLRERIHAACPEVTEAIKWGMPMFLYRGQLMANIAAFKVHASFGVMLRGASVPTSDLAGLGGGMGNFGKLTSLDDVPDAATVAAAVAKIDAGVKMCAAPVAPKPMPAMPDDFAAALAAVPNGRAGFDQRKAVMNKFLAAAMSALLLAVPAAAAEWPVMQGDVVLKDFSFADGQKLPQIKLHYRTLGTPHRGKDGAIDNAVLVLHGTGGTGAQFLRPQFADQLFGPGQPLDITRSYVILPDSIGHGASSKPSDGLRMKFPAYDYDDMVRAQHDMLVKGLGVTRLRLIMGTSMGCMHAFVWGEAYPGFARALMPMACLPVEIAGRNRMWRKLSIDAIKADPLWANGDYSAPPLAGLRTAAALSMMAGSVPLRQQAEAPTRAAVDAALAGQLETAAAASDANDVIYRLDASRRYNPAPQLARITVPVAWINSADDFINPPGLGIAQAQVGKMPNATFRLIPESPQGRGHSTHTWAVFWKDDLIALLRRSQ